MLTVRPSNARGHANHGWLDSHHSFSFASYFDPAQMGFRALRVINEDRVAPREGFGAHSHNDMEIISYVISGKLSHRDSMGTVASLERGDVQVMSAGTGITHSEFNGGDQAPVHFLQIWIIPDQRGHAPRYQDRRFSDADKRDRLCLIASADGRAGSVAIHQDASVYASLLTAGRALEHRLTPGRHAWLQLISGELRVGDTRLGPGDGAFTSDEALLSIAATQDSELLLFDLA